MNSAKPVCRLLLFCLLAAALPSFGQQPVLPRVNDLLLPTEAVHMTGYLAQKLDAAYQNRILAQPVDRLIEPFRHPDETRCWQTEFWGKWLTSATLAYRYRPEPDLKKVLDKAVADLIATQTPDGYIGNYAEAHRLEQWDIWGRKYCLLGLLAYYDLFHDTKTLPAARKLADHLMRELSAHNALIVKQGNHRGMAATSILEPICQLYSRTGDSRYLAFAEEIVTEWETPGNPQLITKATVDVARRFPKPNTWWGWEQGMKAYEMMSCYEGLLELYRLTGKTAYRKAVEETWANIKATEINVVGSGSSVECWFGGNQWQTQPIKKYQETCVTATWIKLSQQLLRLTGDATYADAIEQTYYNALLGSMKSDGSDWAKYSPLAGQRLEGEEQCGMGLNCCVASGPRGLFTLPSTVVMRSAGGVSINFFAAGTYRVKTPANQLAEISQQTEYPATGVVTLTLTMPKAERLALRIRIPAWSQQTSLAINGQPVANVTSGQYATIDRMWQPNDQLTLVLDMRGRVVRMGESAKSIALLRGPLVLARDARLGDPDLDEAITPVVDKDGFIVLEPVNPAPKGVWQAFKAPFSFESYKEDEARLPTKSVMLCDYASAGNTFEASSYFQVWLPQLIDPSQKSY